MLHRTGFSGVIGSSPSPTCELQEAVWSGVNCKSGALPILSARALSKDCRKHVPVIGYQALLHKNSAASRKFSLARGLKVSEVHWLRRLSRVSVELTGISSIQAFHHSWESLLLK